MECMAERKIMITPISISIQNIKKTLTALQNKGKAESECVVLWLGKHTNDGIRVETVWEPEQHAGSDFFEIPENSMEDLFKELRSRRLMIAAQVHSHPRLAFHSWADDKWAIVRHAGALSLVLPHFALRTRQETFIKDAAVFVLSPQNQWQEVPKKQIPKFIKVIDDNECKN